MPSEWITTTRFCENIHCKIITFVILSILDHSTYFLAEYLQICNNSRRITAVSYEAKKLGINRDATPRAQDALKICRNLILIQQPQDADIKLKEASYKIRLAVDSVLQSLNPPPVFQYSSPDESYIDITAYIDSMEERYGYDNLVHQVKENHLWPQTFLYNGEIDGKPSSWLAQLCPWTPAGSKILGKL